MSDELEQAAREGFKELLTSFLDGDKKAAVKHILGLVGGTLGAHILGPWGVTIGSVLVERGVDRVLADNRNTALFKKELANLGEQDRVDDRIRELVELTVQSLRIRASTAGIHGVQSSALPLALTEVVEQFAEVLLSAMRVADKKGLSLAPSDLLFGFDAGTAPQNQKLDRQARSLLDDGDKVGMKRVDAHLSSLVDPETSLKIYREILVESPDDYVALMNVANLERRFGNYDRALAVSSQAQSVADGVGQIALAQATTASLYTMVRDFPSAKRVALAALALVERGGVPFVEMFACGTLAEARFKGGEVAESVPIYQAAVRLCETHGDLIGAEFLRLDISDALRTLGRVKEAGELVQAAREKFSKGDVPLGICLADQRLGLIEMARGRPEAAIRHYEAARTLQQGTSLKELEMSLLGNLVIAHARTGDVRRALLAADDALARARDGGVSLTIALQLKAKGDLLFDAGDLPAADACFAEAKPLIEASGSKEGLAALFISLGNIAYQKEEWASAQGFWEAAVKLNEEMGLVLGSGAAHGNLGRLLKRLGRVPAAIEHFEKALRYFRATDNLPKEVELRHELAQAHASAGRNEIAESILESTLEDLWARGGDQLCGPLLVSLSALKDQLGKRDESYLTYERARDAFAALGERSQVAAQEANLALVACRSNRLECGATHALKSFAICSELGHALGKESARQLLVKIYLTLGDREEAAKYESD